MRADVTSMVALARAAPFPTPTTWTAVAQTEPVPGEGVWATLGGWLDSALIPALVAAAVALGVAAARSRREEQERVRRRLADAYQAYADYKEFAYAIRRRDADAPGAERVRISESLREVQSRLSYNLTWTSVEDEELGRTYGALVAEARVVVGGAMTAAWKARPVASDAEMNIGPELVNLSALGPLEDEFAEASRKHVQHVGRGFLRRLLNWRFRRRRVSAVTPGAPGSGSRSGMAGARDSG